ncbi:jacalin-like lectin [Catenulispora yoronensis]
MLAVGKYWRNSTDYQDASELMKRDLILNARRSIKMSQMDLISAWKKNWSDHVVCQWLIQALQANKDLVVQVVVSPLDAGAGAEGDQYSFGSGAVRTFDLMKYYMTHDVATDAPLPDPGGDHAEALSRLFVAPMYYTDAVARRDTVEGETYKWPQLSPEGYTATLKQPMLSKKPPKRGVIGSAALSILKGSGYIYDKVPSAPGNHAKVLIIDDEAYVVGSDNLYPGSLAEFNYLVEGPAAVEELLRTYWEPLWYYSGPHAVTWGAVPVRLDQVGGGNGSAFDDTADRERVSRIDVYADAVLEGIHVVHENGTVDPLRGGTGTPPGSARKVTVVFDEVDPLIGVSGEWGSWHGGPRITRLQFHRRSGRDTQVFGTADGVTQPRPFAIHAPHPDQQRVIGFFGSTGSGDFGGSRYLESIGIVVR